MIICYSSPKKAIQTLSITQPQAGLDLSMDVFKEISLWYINILCEGEAYIWYFMCLQCLTQFGLILKLSDFKFQLIMCE